MDLIKALCCLTTSNTPAVEDSLQSRLTLLCCHPCWPLVPGSPSLHPSLYPASPSSFTTVHLPCCFLWQIHPPLPLPVHWRNCSLWRDFFTCIIAGTLLLPHYGTYHCVSQFCVCLFPFDCGLLKGRTVICHICISIPDITSGMERYTFALTI